MHHTSHTSGFIQHSTQNTSKRNTPLLSAGFTLIEILVSISIIALLSSVILSSVNSARKNARDSKRISSIRELQTGLELYFTTAQHYPDADTDNEYQIDMQSGDGTNVWDTPYDGDFLTSLVTAKYMQGHVFDPIGTVGDTSQLNLRYYRFPAGSMGCPPERGPFYVLGVSDMEVSNGAHQLSPGWSCPGGTDFNADGLFEFVVGKFES